jgi:hypothetical protein
MDSRAVGAVPGYEFEAPRVLPRVIHHDGLAGAQDSLRQFRPPEHPPEKSSLVRAWSGVLAAMRARNWVTGLAAPILAAMIVGVAAVVVAGGGGGGGAAPSALAAGFPPARLAGADFTGATVTAAVVLGAIAASAGTEVVAGSAGGDPALWVSADGGSAWNRARLTGAAALSRSGSGELAGVAHGAAGWLAVGAVLAGQGAGQAGPIVASSRGGQRWAVSGGPAALPGAGASAVAAAVAAGVTAASAGYVIVGHQVSGGSSRAVAWYAPGLTGWRRATVTKAIAQAGGFQTMNAVTATARGFAAVGDAGADPAAWLSATGRTWRRTALPRPDGAVRATLAYVAATGAAVVAVGTEVSAAGTSSPFAEVSADAGATWRATPLPVPVAGAMGTTVTALAATGGGFTATGAYAVADGEDVAVWTLPSIAAALSGTGTGAAGAGDGWTVATPQGLGLAGPGTQAITALTAEGATLTGVGFTASAVRQPTLWQSPIRN